MSSTQVEYSSCGGKVIVTTGDLQTVARTDTESLVNQVTILQGIIADKEQAAQAKAWVIKRPGLWRFRNKEMRFGWTRFVSLATLYTNERDANMQAKADNDSDPTGMVHGMSKVVPVHQVLTWQEITNESGADHAV